MEEKNLLQKGDIDNWLAKNPPVNDALQWENTQPEPQKINNLIIPVGYTLKEVNSAHFQEYYLKTLCDTFCSYRKDQFSFALWTGEEPPLSITADENGMVVIFDSEEIHKLKQYVVRQTEMPVDMLHFLVKPEAFNHFHKKKWPRNGYIFGYANDICTVVNGPYTYNHMLMGAGSVFFAHEMAHALSYQLSMRYDPCFNTDYATRAELYSELKNIGLTETQLLQLNCLSEYFLEDPQNPGTPLKSQSLLINKTIAEYKHETGEELVWHDTGLCFLNEKTGITHRILCPGDGKNLMADFFPNCFGFYVSYPISPFQKLLFANQAELFLCMEKRKENPALNAECEAYTENMINEARRIVSAETIAVCSNPEAPSLPGTGSHPSASHPLPQTYNFSTNKTLPPYRG